MDTSHYSLELKIFLEKLSIKYIFQLKSELQKRNFTNDKNRQKLKNQKYNFQKKSN